MGKKEALGGGFLLLRSVAGATLTAAFHTGGVEGSSDDMIPNTRQIFHTPPSNQHNGMLLKVMPFPRDIGRHFNAVSQLDAGHLAQGGIGLLGCGRIDSGAHPPALRTSRQGWGRSFGFGGATTCSDKLLNRGHEDPPEKQIPTII